MKNKKIKMICTIHNPYYCLITGGMRCRKCKILLNDFGNEYKLKENKNVSNSSNRSNRTR